MIGMLVKKCTTQLHPILLMNKFIDNFNLHEVHYGEIIIVQSQQLLLHDTVI